MRTEQLTKCCEPQQKMRVRQGACKTGLSPPVIYNRPFQSGTAVVVQVYPSYSNFVFHVA